MGEHVRESNVLLRALDEHLRELDEHLVESG
jgi:hypothetical protein